MDSQNSRKIIVAGGMAVVVDGDLYSRFTPTAIPWPLSPPATYPIY